VPFPSASCISFDEQALDLALEWSLAGRSPTCDKLMIEAIRRRLAVDGWEDAALFCVSIQQSHSLGLTPWQTAPCDVDPDSPRPGDEEAAELLRRMAAAGISIFHPDPIQALAKVKSS
jgi:hypothetical protein